MLHERVVGQTKPSGYSAVSDAIRALGRAGGIKDPNRPSYRLHLYLPVIVKPK